MAVYYGDIHIGTIVRRIGIPNNAPRWSWRCGFYPGSLPGEHLSGIADDFEIPRADFEATWRIFSANRTGADYQEWRHQRDWTTEKYRRFDVARGGCAAISDPVGPYGRVANEESTPILPGTAD